MGFCFKRQVLPALLLFHYSTHFVFCLSAMQAKYNGTYIYIYILLKLQPRDSITGLPSIRRSKYLFYKVVKMINEIAVNYLALHQFRSCCRYLSPFSLPLTISKLYSFQYHMLVYSTQFPIRRTLNNWTLLSKFIHCMCNYFLLCDDVQFDDQVAEFCSKLQHFSEYGNGIIFFQIICNRGFVPLVTSCIGTAL